mmetsp:Transcript_357/g.651  ORF Transcript_357/g.651 Transcript_357/m.651 type:complete len:309 (+) Transcript_357:1351-2277(+)
MCVAPGEGTELDSRNEQGQLLALVLEILSVDHPRKVKHLGPVVDLGPKPVLEELFGLAQVLRRLELIEVRKDTHDLWKAVRLQNVQEFKGLHLESKLGVDAQQDQIGNLGTVQHGRGVVAGALQQRDALVLGGDDRDGPRDGRQVVVGVELDQRADQGGLSDPLGTHHDDERRGGLVGVDRAAIGEGDVFLLLGSIEVSLDGPLGSDNVGDRECSVVVAFLPGSLFLGLVVLLSLLGTAALLLLLVPVVFDQLVALHGDDRETENGAAASLFLSFFVSFFVCLVVLVSNRERLWFDGILLYSYRRSQV